MKGSIMFKPYGLDFELVDAKFSSLKNNVKLVLFIQENHCNHCNEAKRMYEWLASVYQKIKFEIFNIEINLKKDWEYKIFAVPALAIIGIKDYGIRYYGYPQGPEIINLIDDIVYVSRGETTLPTDVTQKLHKLDKITQLKIFISSTCPYSLPIAKLGLKLAITSDNINVDIIDATQFLEVAEKFNVRGIPMTVINNEKSFYGALDYEEYVDQIIRQA